MHHNPNPRHKETYQKGKNLINNGKFTAALSEFSRFPETDMQAQYQIARIYIKRKEFDNALRTLTKAMRHCKSDFDTALIQSQVIVCHVQRGNIEKAYKTYHDIKHIAYPHVATAIASIFEAEENYVGGLSLIKQALHKWPNNIYLLAMQAQLFEQQGQGDDAIASYRNIMSLYPDDIHIKLAYCFVLIRLDKKLPAIQELQQLIKTAPTFKKAKLAYAMLLDNMTPYLKSAVEREQYQSTAEKLYKELTDNTVYWKAYLSYARLLQRQRRVDESTFVLDKILRPTPMQHQTNIPTRQEVARAYFSMALANLYQGTYTKAQDCIEKSLRYDPNYIHALSLRDQLSPTFEQQETSEADIIARALATMEQDEQPWHGSLSQTTTQPTASLTLKTNPVHAIASSPSPPHSPSAVFQPRLMPSEPGIAVQNAYAGLNIEEQDDSEDSEQKQEVKSFMPSAQPRMRNTRSHQEMSDAEFDALKQENEQAKTKPSCQARAYGLLANSMSYMFSRVSDCCRKQAKVDTMREKRPGKKQLEEIRRRFDP